MHAVNSKVLQATINYLATQPYSQVAELINALSQSQPVNPVETPEPTLEE